MSRRTDRRREIERLFAERAREGCSLRELSSRSGIPVGTLSWWSHRLREDSTPAFAEVEVIPDGIVIDDASDTEVPLRLRLGDGVVVEFSGDLAKSVALALVESVSRWS